MKKKSEYQRMVQGQLYNSQDPELKTLAEGGRLLVEEYNATSRTETKKRRQILDELMDSVGERVHVEAPFYVDYGCNITLGDDFYANFGCIFLDVCPIKIGNQVMFGPRVGLYTPSHPLDGPTRNRGLELGRPITIEDGCWLAGDVVVNPGVTIGENTVVLAGAVVTKDLPANSLCGGVPCRVLRPLTEEDRTYWEAQEAAYYQDQEEEALDDEPPRTQD